MPTKRIAMKKLSALSVFFAVLALVFVGLLIGILRGESVPPSPGQPTAVVNPPLSNDSPTVLVEKGVNISANFEEGSYTLVMIPIPFGKSELVYGPRESAATWAPATVMVAELGVNGVYTPDAKTWFAVIDQDKFVDTGAFPDFALNSLFAALQQEYGDQTCSQIDDFVAFLNSTLTIDAEALSQSLQDRCRQ